MEDEPNSQRTCLRREKSPSANDCNTGRNAFSTWQLPRHEHKEKSFQAGSSGKNHLKQPDAHRHVMLLLFAL